MPSSSTVRKIALHALAVGASLYSSPSLAQAVPGRLVALEAGLANEFNGVVLATRDSRTIYSHAFGLADAETGDRNVLANRFRIGSISKTFTASLAYRLAARGTLALDQPVSSFVEDIPGGDRITIRDLILHRSGLHDFSQEDWRRLLLATPALSPDDVLPMIASKKPRSQPGRKYAYNNAGYVLLGIILARAAGKPYGELLQEEILVPLGILDTGLAPHDVDITGLSRGHDRRMKVDKNPYNYSAIAPAGGLYSTAADLARWCEVQDDLAMLESWQSGERFGQRAFWHPGNTNSYSALLVRFPETDGCYVVLSNVGRKAPPSMIMRELPQLLFAS